MSTHKANAWEFVATTYGDGSPCYGVKTATGKLIATTCAETDAECVEIAQHIAKAVSFFNMHGTTKATGAAA